MVTFMDQVESIADLKVDHSLRLVSAKSFPGKHSPPTLCNLYDEH